METVRRYLSRASQLLGDAIGGPAAADEVAVAPRRLEFSPRPALGKRLRGGIDGPADYQPAPAASTPAATPAQVP